MADTSLGRHPQGRHPQGRHPQTGTPLGRHPPGRHSLADTPRADTPSLGKPPGQTPPSPQIDGYCSGRYASYWNAFLFYFYFHRLISIMNKTMCGSFSLRSMCLHRWHYYLFTVKMICCPGNGFGLVYSGSRQVLHPGNHQQFSRCWFQCVDINRSPFVLITVRINVTVFSLMIPYLLSYLQRKCCKIRCCLTKNF